MKSVPPSPSCAVSLPRVLRIALTSLCLSVATPGLGLAGDLAASSQARPAGKAGSASGPAKSPKPRKKKKKKKPPSQTDHSNDEAVDEPDDDMDEVVAELESPHESLFFGENRHGYGFEVSLGTSVSKVQEAAARLDTGGLALLVDHDTVFGLSATRQAVPADHEANGVDLTSSLTYYGLTYGDINGWDEIANVRYQLFLGAGTLHVEAETGDAEDFGMYVAEPLWGIYFNVLPWLRLGLDVTYRFVVVNEAGVRGEAYSGWSGGLVLRGGDL